MYNHIDIKLHPITLQLDGAVLSALTAFFKVRGAGGDDERDGRRLDRVMGISAIARAGDPSPLPRHCAQRCTSGCTRAIHVQFSSSF